MTTAIATTNGAAESGAIVERVVIVGDLSGLKPHERVEYYQRTCESIGLNPLTQPFAYIVLNGKMTLYAKKDATDQLRRIYDVSVAIVARERIEDVYVVTARATLPNGRTDESVGVVSIGSLKGDGLANALMKAETKSKRRVTLSICGLGWLDETEIETIPDARQVRVSDTGDIIDSDTKPVPAATYTQPQSTPVKPATLPAPTKTSPVDFTRALHQLESDIRLITPATEIAFDPAKPDEVIAAGKAAKDRLIAYIANAGLPTNDLTNYNAIRELALEAYYTMQAEA